MLAKSPFLFDEHEALRLMAVNAERQGPLDCEITEGSRADWFLVRTFPGEESRAMRWLAKRGFGAFRPMQQRTDKRNGQKVQGWEAVFPGWVFVFTWNIVRMKHRIKVCPGVMDIFSDPATQKPVSIQDEFVQRLRSIGWNYEDNAHRMTISANYVRKSRSPRLDKRNRRTLKKLKKTLKRQGKFDSSTAEMMKDLAPFERIALLQRAVTNSAALAG